MPHWRCAWQAHACSRHGRIIERRRFAAKIFSKIEYISLVCKHLATSQNHSVSTIFMNSLRKNRSSGECQKARSHHAKGRSGESPAISTSAMTSLSQARFRTTSQILSIPILKLGQSRQAGLQQFRKFVLKKNGNGSTLSSIPR